MYTSLKDLTDYEREALLNALRRDLNSEKTKSETDAVHRNYHQYNVRILARLLEFFNPRHIGRSTSDLGSGNDEAVQAPHVCPERFLSV
jgi:ribosomal protein L29